MTIADKKRIHIALLRNPFSHVTDQCEALYDIVRRKGGHISIGRRPVVGAINIFFENFFEGDAELLRSLSETGGSQVLILLTEHMAVEKGRWVFNGSEFHEHDDYQQLATRLRRIVHFADCANLATGLVSIGDLPRLAGYRSFIPNAFYSSLPLPPLDFAERGVERERDACFFGAATEHRRLLLDRLGAEGFSFFTSDVKVSRSVRNRIARSGSIALNIPQNKDWRWVSTMRVYSLLRCGVPVVSLSGPLEGALGGVIDYVDPNEPEELEYFCKNDRDLYFSQAARYEAVISEPWNGDWMERIIEQLI